ncbi:MULTISPECIES: HD-GYP domain-containing protein [Desulfitobacterium]|uniref:HD-GYP domain-containing protein n=1 Tax=Desulfitobacterium dehalogenans (strain ATCC 51507 / DSM 9161 / JW/IU-DC1) TaxID=756499 RepID=I4A7X4_DESDJ|nr:MULTISPECIES: HD-GYP domain-containing protein [Desulfitobacterium]AFM00059.1 HD-GYP domain-containing protein [Desulfitobacterium dehalogenans ATCC 51507]
MEDRTVIKTINAEGIIGQHGYRVSRLCVSMGRQLGLTERAITELSIAGLFHDLGKIAVCRAILEKPGKLTTEEYTEIKRHSEIGYRILGSVRGMENMAEFVLYHHERWDGKGYPRQLKGGEIPLYSRVIGLADAYDAMTNNRSYRKALSKKAAIQELLRNSGTQFDPELVGEFIKTL